MSYFVYMLQCNDNTLYTGITVDVKRRVQEHNSSPKGAKYTRVRRPVELVYVEESGDRSSASKREYIIKNMKKKQKLELINSNTLLTKFV